MQYVHTPRVDTRYWTAITLASVFGTNREQTTAYRPDALDARNWNRFRCRPRRVVEPGQRSACVRRIGFKRNLISARR